MTVIPLSWRDENQPKTLTEKGGRPTRKDTCFVLHTNKQKSERERERESEIERVRD